MDYKKETYTFIGKFEKDENSLKLKEQFDKFVSEWKCEDEFDDKKYYNFDQILKMKDFFDILEVKETIKNGWLKNILFKKFSFDFSFSSTKNSMWNNGLTYELKIMPPYENISPSITVTSHQVIWFD